MTILFIGGTGRLSKDVASLAVKKGHDVYILTRGSKGREIFVRKEYYMVYADIRDSETCKEYIQKLPYFDVVIDFLSFEPEHLENKLLMLEGRFSQYIFISSATVHQRIPGEKISEDKTPVGNSLWTYAQNKFLAEEFLKKYFEGIENKYYTIVRPYVTYSEVRIPYPLVPRDNTMEWSLIYRIMNDKYIPTFDGGNTITSLLHTYDFAVAVVGLFGNSATYNAIYNIANENTNTWGDVLRILAKILDKPLRIRDFTQEEIGESLPEYKELLRADKGQAAEFDISKIKKTVPEFKCEISLEEGLQGVVDFYLGNPEFQKIDHEWDKKLDELLEKENDGK